MMRVHDRPKTNSGHHSGAGFLRVAAVAIGLGLTLALLLPAQAQFWSPFAPTRRPPGAIPQQQPQQYNQQYNPFSGFFTPQEPRREAPVDYSHAPAAQPRHPDVAPTTPVVVVGDAMADWLAYGLEDAFADEGDISIVRKPRAGSGLIRYDPRRDVDWAQTAREVITAEKPKFVVMMVGTNDHQSIRDRAVPAAAHAGAPSPAQAKPAAPVQAAPAASPPGDPAALTAEDPPNPDQADNPEQPSLVAPTALPVRQERSSFIAISGRPPISSGSTPPSRR